MTAGSRVGLVLSGAAALGAYEAGVASYVVDEVAAALGGPVRFHVISGTSAGGINAAALAALADDPAAGGRALCAVWSSLEVGEILRPSAVEIARILLDLDGRQLRAHRALRAGRARGGLLDPRPLERLLASRLPMDRIAGSVRAGHVGAVALSTTHVATGDAVVFYQAGDHEPWPRQRGLVPRATTLRIDHALASAAIPLLWAPVWIDGDLYCDGGLRQLVPLAPAIHLGATRLLVVAPLPRVPLHEPDLEEARRGAATSPLFLLGKNMNALFSDRMEADLDRLAQINDVIRAGRARFGPAFEADVNDELTRLGAGALRHVDVMRLGPGAPLGALAIEHVQSRAFDGTARTAAGRLLRCLADRDPSRAGDLLSYLLFDGAFAAELVALGRADAAAHHEELCAFLAGSAPQDERARRTRGERRSAGIALSGS